MEIGSWVGMVAPWTEACLNVPNNMGYTITYFLFILSTEPHTRARSELFIVSLVSPRVNLYTALLVLWSKSKEISTQLPWL